MLWLEVSRSKSYLAVSMTEMHNRIKLGDYLLIYHWEWDLVLIIIGSPWEVI